MTRAWHLSYQIRGDRTGHGASVASIACGKGCGRVDTKTVTGNMNPEMIKKHFERQGWDFDLTNARRCICPACKEKPKLTVTTIERRGQPRPLTVDEKAKARHLLDKHFDDAKGCFIDGYSDQRIGAELNIPHASIAAFRELAYGPLKISPELTAALDDLAKLRIGHSQIGDQLRALMERHSQIAADITAAIARVQKAG